MLLVYPGIQNGSAILSDSLADWLRVPRGSTVADTFKGGGYEQIVEARGPIYTER